jgi:cytidine deaminase
MVAAGRRSIVEVVVAAGGDGACTPCGGCRQKIREFGQPGTLICMVDASGAVRLVRSLGELLPDSFGPANLDR